MNLSGARSALAGSRFSELRHVEETGSTNTDLVDSARRGEVEQALVADHQTAGRGRLDRVWEAPPEASLLMSVLVREPFPAASVHLVPTALAVALVDSIAALDGPEVGLKWPNDLVAPGAGDDGSDLKLGGMLSEMGDTTPGNASVVVGVGVNVAWGVVPTHLAATATSLDLLGATLDRWELVAEVLGRFERTLGAADLRDRYRAACVTIGRRVRVERPAGALVGTAIDIADAGALIVDADGVRHEVSIGDVIHLRPA